MGYLTSSGVSDLMKDGSAYRTALSQGLGEVIHTECLEQHQAQNKQAEAFVLISKHFRGYPAAKFIQVFLKGSKWSDLEPDPLPESIPP